MRLIRYRKADGLLTYGWILSQVDEMMVGPIEGSPYGEYRRMEAELPLSSVRLLAPVQPSKIICVGLNYAIHAKEIGAAIPEVPLLFLKPPSTLVGPEDEIKLPPQSQQVEHEAELVAVIRARGRWIPPEEALSYILGYTVGNDVTARDLQHRDGQWTRSKGFDTFCPIGPWIETEFDPADQVVTCYVNGEMRQMSSTRDMVFNLRQLIAFISSIMTLEAGDIIMTGTPAGVGPLLPGDMVEVSIEGIGTLRNPVVSENVS
jgi:2-keto-4-pentenoate hydratase/2-oxohepta-3-ene-1,7-dioic acid hydratase in catechol pathway